VQVNLPLFQTSIVLPKLELLELFPESILAQTAQEFGDTFEITNPVVTPQALTLIQQILLTRDLPMQPPGDVYSMLAAFDYLNMPQLNILTDPFYSLFRFGRPEINLLDIKPVLQDFEMYRNLLRDCIEGGGSTLAQYFIENAPVEAKIQSINESLFVYAAAQGQEEMSVLLPRVNPVTAKSNHHDLVFEDHRDYMETRLSEETNQVLLYACLYGRASVLRVLLKDPRVQVIDPALWLTNRAGSMEAFQVVALDPKTPASEINDMLDYLGISPIQVRILLSRPEANPNKLTEIWQSLVSFEPDNVTVIGLLVRDPRTDINAMLKREFENYYNIPVITAMHIITNPKFDPLAQTDYFYASMVWVWPLEVLSTFLDRFPQALGKIYPVSVHDDQLTTPVEIEERQDLHKLYPALNNAQDIDAIIQAR
jgi:hypothetical protein